MSRTSKQASYDLPDQGRLNTSLVIASMLLAVAISYMLIVLQPDLAKAITAAWGHIVAPASGNPKWAVPTIAAGIAIGAASLAMLVLSAFISGVQRAPYLWLSPVLVGFSTLVLSRLHVQLPFAGASLSLLSTLAGLLLLGGGALVQLRGVACALSGWLLLALPATTLIAGHIVRAGNARLAWSGLNTPSALYLFVLSVTSIGVAIVAFVTRPGGANDALHAAMRLQQQRDQLARAQEQARLLELHLGEAERRAELAEHELRARSIGRRDDTDAFLTLARPSIAWVRPVGVLIALAAISLAAYAGMYRPLTRRIAAQQAFAAEAARDHADEVEALRKRFETERASALAALTAERNRMATALAAAEQVHANDAPPRSAGAAAVNDAPPLAPLPAPSVHSAVAREAAAAQPKQKPKAQLKAPSRASSRHSAKKISAARAASKSGTAPALRGGAALHAKKPAITRAKPEADGADQDPAHALKESVNDDPIGGLDGM